MELEYSTGGLHRSIQIDPFRSRENDLSPSSFSLSFDPIS